MKSVVEYLENNKLPKATKYKKSTKTKIKKNITLNHVNPNLTGSDPNEKNQTNQT